MINLGETVQDFILKDQENKEISLKELRGKRVLLSFHPLAFTPVCALQMKSLEENLETLTQLNTVPLGFSIDHAFTKGAWAKELGIQNVRLLADFWPHGEIAKRLDIFRERDGFSERVNIILDENGKVIFAKLYPIKEVPDMNEIIEFLKKN